MDFLPSSGRHEAAENLAPLPAIALTAFARETDQRMAIEAGYAQHVGKPVEPGQLLSVILQVLDHRKQ